MKINEKEYSLRFSGKTLIIFKEEFGEDMLLLVNKLLNDGLDDMTLLFKITYAMIKTNGYDIENFMDWCDSISNINELLSEKSINEILTTLAKDRTPNKQLKKN